MPNLKMHPRLGWKKSLKVSSSKPLRSHYKSVDTLLNYLQFEKSNSLSSIRTYCMILHSFCKFANNNPDELVKKDSKRLSKLIKAFADRPSRSTANSYVSRLKTFFRTNRKEGIDYPRYFMLSRRASNIYIPTLKECEKMAVCTGSLRDRAIIMLLYSTGSRNSSLRAYRYNEHPDVSFLHDYTIKSELEQGFDNILVAVYPGMKKNITEACIGNICYYTFTSKEATEAIIEYLEERIRKCGKIEDDEYLFPSAHRGYRKEERNKIPMSETELQKMTEKAARRAGIRHWKQVTPTSLRKTYSSTLKNQLGFEDKEFFMGHVLPGTSEDYFDPTNIEAMRRVYSWIVFSDNSETALERRDKKTRTR